MDRRAEVERLFAEASERPVNERDRFLSRATADEAICAEVRSLLQHAGEGHTIAGAIGAAAVEMQSNAAHDLTGRSLGPYRIVNLIGSGGMGEVYAAEDERLDRRVALKVLPVLHTGDEDRIRRFQQEARAASALNHPNIVTIFDVGAAEGIHYLAAELIEGRTLREMLSAGPLATRELCRH